LRSDLSASRIAYAGDDLVDIPIMRRVGLAFAPANARPEVKKAAHYVTTAAGGEGAVREMVEILLQAIGAWSVILKHYEVE
jgi:3-deoxy-D-manno-octulosonate 8-phosphate phosphatase (KDO 8-P phosphatase)